MADILRSGALDRRRNLRYGRAARNVRERILSGRDTIPVTHWCSNCKSECLQNFEGRVVFVVGLNNAMHAAEEPFIRFDTPTHEPTNAQVFNIYRYEYNYVATISRK